MLFKSKKDLFASIVIWGAVALLLISAVETFQQGGVERWFVLLMVLIAALLLWMWFGTYYVITGNELKYKSGPINGIIAINSIKSIITHKTQFVGLKPSLGSKGCIIKYNKFDEIYLSPKKQDLFVDELVKINPAIEVVAS